MSDAWVDAYVPQGSPSVASVNTVGAIAVSKAPRARCAFSNAAVRDFWVP